jgi:hypothetical protein
MEADTTEETGTLFSEDVCKGSCRILKTKGPAMLRSRRGITQGDSTCEVLETRRGLMCARNWKEPERPGVEYSSL